VEWDEDELRSNMTVEGLCGVQVHGCSDADEPEELVHVVRLAPRQLIVIIPHAVWFVLFVPPLSRTGHVNYILQCIL